jgi:hypothetical protein
VSSGSDKGPQQYGQRKSSGFDNMQAMIIDRKQSVSGFSKLDQMADSLAPNGALLLAVQKKKRVSLQCPG